MGRLGETVGRSGWVWLAACLAAAAQEPCAPRPNGLVDGGWTSERIELRDGRHLRGLIESEDDLWTYVLQIEQPAGRPMFAVIRPVEKAKIKAVTRLEPAAREALRRHVEQFVHRAQIEAGAMEAVRLESRGRDAPLRYCYQGRWFSLESTLDDQASRRVIVRMEQLFTAYRQLLPQRTAGPRLVRVLVFGSMEEYRDALERFGLKAMGPRAVFLPATNVVIAGSEINRIAAEVAKVKAEHDKLQAELDQYRKELPGRLERIGDQLRRQGNSPSQIRNVLNTEKRKADETIKQKELEIKQLERRNEKSFDAVAAHTLRSLSHEAFHAYLDNYVYPRSCHDVPAWLDEGLAMIFEEGFLESGVLRLGAVHRIALKTLKADLAGREPLTIERVVQAGQREYLGSGEGSFDRPNRYYCYAWGLAYYLTFERRLLADPALDRYVDARSKELAPAQRLEQLVGMPLAKFETVWHKYIQELR